MSNLAAPSAADAPHPSAGQTLVLRLRVLAAMIVSALIFWHVGWWVVRPTDPAGPVSLLMIDNGIIAMAQLLGITMAASGLAVAICGAGSAERGPLAVAVGLAALALRGGQMDDLILFRFAAAGEQQRAIFPTWELIAETWLWLALIGVGLVVGRWVQSWFANATAPATAPETDTDTGADIRQGLGAIIATAFVAWTVTSFTSGPTTMPLMQGQIYFAIALGFLFGAMAGQWIFRTHSRLWSLVAVAVVATAAYLFGGAPDNLLREIPNRAAYTLLKPIARPLPIEYAALGAIGVLLERDARNLLLALFGIHPADSNASQYED